MNRRSFLLHCAGLASVAVSQLVIANPTADVASHWPTSQRDALQTLVAALLPVVILGEDPALLRATTQHGTDWAKASQQVMATVVYLPQSDQSDLYQLAEHCQSQLGLWLLTGHFASLGGLSATDKLQWLSQWQHHYLQLLQQAYLGLRELLTAGFYSLPEHWPALNYRLPWPAQPLPMSAQLPQTKE